MLKKLLAKWFGLDLSCETCDVLRERLVCSERERADLLRRLLDKDVAGPLVQSAQQEFKPIMPQFVPWRVKQQMYEAEDRKRAELLRNKTKEIDALEEELGVKDASKEPASI